MMPGIWRVAAVGLMSTLSMDLLTGLATAMKITAPLSPHLIGRWFAYVARAQPVHADIGRSSAVPYELLIAVPVHYAIGTVLATMFVWGASEFGWPRGVASALAFGLSTSVLPWLVMFPAMGYGVFGLHGPGESRLFVSSLMSHAFFGLGLWMAVHVLECS